MIRPAGIVCAGSLHSSATLIASSKPMKAKNVNTEACSTITASVLSARSGGVSK